MMNMKGIGQMTKVLVVGGGMSIATSLASSGKVNVGTIGHCDHGVLEQLPPGTYDATVTGVAETEGELIVEFKTSGKARTGKTITNANQMALYQAMHKLYIEEAYEMPKVKAEQSWQALNKGKHSKKQRRAKF